MGYAFHLLATGTRANWTAEGVFEELYNHTGLNGSDFDKMDVDNFAYNDDPEVQSRVQYYFKKVHEMFAVLQPPTSPAGTSPEN